MKKHFILCLNLSLVSVLFSSAQTINVNCIADAIVAINSGCPSWETTNNGAAMTNAANTWTWYAESCDQGNMRSLLLFNMNVPSDPHRLYDNRATLYLYFPTGSSETHWYTGSANDNQLYVQRVTSPWAEMAVTWDTQPTITNIGQATAPSAVPNPSTQDYQIDISTLVYNWICNSAANYGLELKLVNEGTTYRRVTFTSRDYADTMRRPAIKLEYAQIDVAAPDTICSGNAFTISCSLTNAANPGLYQFQWTHLNTGTNYNTQNVLNPAHVNGLNTYVVAVSNPWCQTATDTVQVFAGNQPNATAGYNAPLCTGDSLKLSASGATFYQWSGPNGFVSNQQNPAIPNASPLLSGAYTVTMDNGVGCSSTLTVNVSINPLPVLNLSASPDSICPGQSTSLAASGAFMYFWSTGASGTPVIVFPDSSMFYSVTGITAFGCTSTAAISVTVNPSPTVSALANPDSVCIGQSTSLSALGASTYAWSGGATGSPVNVFPASTMNYTVTGTSTTGCSSTAAVHVTVSTLPVITASANPVNVCEGASTVLMATGASTYSWSTSGTGSTIIISPTASATYTVTGTSTAGCSGTATVSINFIPNPIVSISGNTQVCMGTPDLLTASGATTYTWSTGGTGTTDLVTPLVSTTYTVTGMNAFACGDTATFTVNALPLPLPVITMIAETCAGASDGLAIANADNGTPPYNFIWNNGQSGDTIKGIGAGIYSVTATDAYGCMGTISGTAEASTEPCYIPNLYIPNIFTPNGDGNNDVFYVRGAGIKSVDFSIYDRWGQKVFEGKSLSDGWDGTKNGKSLDEGVFVYYLKAAFLDGTEKKLKGTITLVR